jgi:hypothetical protein
MASRLIALARALEILYGSCSPGAHFLSLGFDYRLRFDIDFDSDIAAIFKHKRCEQCCSHHRRAGGVFE